MTTKRRVFLLDDDELIVSMLARALRKEGYDVQAESDPADVLAKIRTFGPDLVMLDIKLPGRKTGIDLLQEIVAEGAAGQVVMLTSDDSAETAVRAMKLGASDYLTKPFNLDEVKIVVKNAVEKSSLKQEVSYLRKVSSELFDKNFVGASSTVRNLKEQAERLAQAGVSTILITGESGTGKEVFARYTHRLMHQDEGGSYAPFVGINCAALPEHLIESELFGHEKGAFTDAKAEKKGVFELAGGGSILLDEIGEMQPLLQSKLLRVIEERQVRRVGGKHDIAVDATVFATTNRDLREAVGAGEFRVDLFYRLNAFAVHIGPLRERREDVLALANHFLELFSNRYNRTTLEGFSPEAQELLAAHDWPGNTRELRNVVERIVVLEQGELVLAEHLPAEIRQASASGGAEPAEGGIHLPDSGLSLVEVERKLIVQALERTGGNKTKAAKLLDMTYDALRYQIKKFGLD